MTKTRTATCDHTTTTRKIQIARHGRCTRCNNTGTVQICNTCGIIGCDGNCACGYCLGEKKITCQNSQCDQGHLIDENGEQTDTKCPDCKGKGRVACPEC
jgi:hypothetical protein